MGLERPTGNVIVNTVWCKYSKVNDKELNNFILPNSDVYSSDDERTCQVNEQSGPHTVAKYAKTVQKIASINL